MNKVYDFSASNGIFRKVAFDVYEKTGEGTLWELREAEDGKKYLIALYADEGEVVQKTASLRKWSALADSAGQNVTLFYKTTPIYRFASANFGFSDSEASEFANFVSDKAESNPEWLNKLVASMPATRQAFVKGLIG